MILDQLIEFRALPGCCPLETTLRDLLKPEAAVFRRFDGSGKMIGGFVPESQIQVPISIWPHSGVFGSAGSRIFWYSSKEGSAIEISLNGVVTRFSARSLADGETERGGLALTEDGNVFVSSIGRSGWEHFHCFPAAGSRAQRQSSSNHEESYFHSLRILELGLYHSLSEPELTP